MDRREVEYELHNLGTFKIDKNNDNICNPMTIIMEYFQISNGKSKINIISKFLSLGKQEEKYTELICGFCTKTMRPFITFFRFQFLVDKRS